MIAYWDSAFWNLEKGGVRLGDTLETSDFLGLQKGVLIERVWGSIIQHSTCVILGLDTYLLG